MLVDARGNFIRHQNVQRVKMPSLCNRKLLASAAFVQLKEKLPCRSWKCKRTTKAQPSMVRVCPKCSRLTCRGPLALLYVVTSHSCVLGKSTSSCISHGIIISLEFSKREIPPSNDPLVKCLQVPQDIVVGVNW